jgi:hypothetical protein
MKSCGNLNMPVTTAYLDTLNSEQRRAVEHGLSQEDCATAGPPLVIADMLKNRSR